MTAPWVDSAALWLSHWREALLQCGVFIMGAFSAFIVLRYRVHLLLAFPVWMAKRLTAFLARKPGALTLFVMISCFNSAAMFCYMMTGALDPHLPTAICFLTGMNIAIVATLMPALAAEPNAVVGGSGQPGRVELICFLLTLGLELPVFWVSMAMGSSMAPPWWRETAIQFGPILPRVQAYLLVSVPVLCVSAAVEAVGIRAGLKRQPPASSETPPDA